MPNGFSAGVRMSPEEMVDYVAMVQRARDEWSGRVDVRLGLEADYFAGYEGWLERQLSSENFQYVLGSVHPQILEFKEQYWDNDPMEIQRTYFRLLADAAETGLFDSLAHPDLIKNMTAPDWDPTAIMSDICRALDRIAATGIAMELNTSGANKLIPQMNPFPEMLVEMRTRGIPVVIGSDAHEPWRVGDRFEEALRLLSRCGYSEVCNFIERQRQAVSIEAALASLNDRQTA
jgi:histidinol-phosphatase (PHP family)